MREPHYWRGTLEVCGLPLWVEVDIDAQIVTEVILDGMPPVDISVFASEYGPFNQPCTLEDQIMEYVLNKVRTPNPIGEP